MCFGLEISKTKKKTSLEQKKKLFINIHMDSCVSAQNLKCPSLARLGSARNLFSSARLTSGNFSSNSSLGNTSFFKQICFTCAKI
jgi:hypothetical protein